MGAGGCPGCPRSPEVVRGLSGRATPGQPRGPDRAANACRGVHVHASARITRATPAHDETGPHDSRADPGPPSCPASPTDARTPVRMSPMCPARARTSPGRSARPQGSRLRPHLRREGRHPREDPARIQRRPRGPPPGRHPHRHHARPPRPPHGRAHHQRAGPRRARPPPGDPHRPLAGPYDPHGAGKVLFVVFAAIAEVEREFIRERALVGLDTAAANGKHGGRPPAVDGDISPSPCAAAPPRREGVRLRHRRAPRRQPLHPVPHPRLVQRSDEATKRRSDGVQRNRP